MKRKKIVISVFFTLVVLCIAAVGIIINSDELKIAGNPNFNAEVLETHDGGILIQQLTETGETKPYSEIYVSLYGMSQNSETTLSAGDRVKILYSGEVAESYPGQIHNTYAVYLLDTDGEVITPAVYS